MVVVANGVVGVWATAAHWRGALRSRLLTGATYVAWAAVFVQIVMGAALIRGRDTEPYALHVLYGFSGAFAVGIIYSYRNQVDARHRQLLYGLGTLFIMGCALRAMTLITS